MDNPVLVEVVRGSAVESGHRGAFIVVDADGAVVMSAGDVERPVFPRSAVKAIQALPLLEGGHADRYGLSAAEIALCCSSHSGEPHHAAASASMLAKAGHDPSCLECGTHWPMYEKAARAMAASGASPSALHNNCSGKHAGFVCLSCGLDEDPAGYINAGHAVQRAVRGALIEMTGAAHDPETAGIDGCSIPTHAVPLRALALAFARFGAGGGKGAAMGPERVKASRRIRAAVAAHPEMVAGTGRFDTRVMQALGARAFTKTGAEAVFCGALQELGYDIALKIDDGGTRASEAVMASLLARLLAPDGPAAEVLDMFARPRMVNWNGIEVGHARVIGL
ncbi:MAG: asparaginase [Bosea sp.]|nr:asparaginase [Bosea sp. (in: a-proteobacteria)]